MASGNTIKFVRRNVCEACIDVSDVADVYVALSNVGTSSSEGVPCSSTARHTHCATAKLSYMHGQ